MRSHAYSFGQLFSLLFILFIGLLAATALQAWTGPTATAPNGNISAPINVGTTDQVKNAGLSLNALTVYGRQYIQSGLNIGVVTTNQVVALNVNGSIKLGNGGESCQSVTAGVVFFNSSTGKLEYCDGSDWYAVNATLLSVTPGSQSYNSAGSYTFTVPAYNTISVTVNGAGGGGAGTSGGYPGDWSTYEGRGGSGGQAVKTYSSGQLTVGTGIAVVVGSAGGGGAGGAPCGGSDGGTGGTGGNSSFNGAVIGNGGSGGYAGPNSPGAANYNGADGQASGGDSNITGGAGNGIDGWVGHVVGCGAAGITGNTGTSGSVSISW